MKKVFLAITVLFCFQQINAQYTEIINSKRPGFSESPYSVGKNVYQLETGVYYLNGENTIQNTYYSKVNTLGGELFLRIGKFIEQLELNVNIAYQGNEIKALYRQPPTDYVNSNVNGISDLRIGAKYLIYQQEYEDKSKEIRSWKKRTSYDKKRFIPSVGLYLGVVPISIGNDYKDNDLNLKAAVLLQNDFSNRLIVITNLIVDEILLDNMAYAYIVTATYALSPNWSIFLENVGKYQNTFKPDYQLGSGVAYLISPNLQADASVRTSLFTNQSYIYASTGISWRIDKHKDPEIVKSALPETKKKKGFFSKLFGKN